MRTRDMRAGVLALPVVVSLVLLSGFVAGSASAGVPPAQHIGQPSPAGARFLASFGGIPVSPTFIASHPTGNAVSSAAYLSLGPAVQYPHVGQVACAFASVEDQGHLGLPGIEVNFAVTGANPTSGYASTSSGGDASLCYAGNARGLDTLTATVGNLSATALLDFGGQQGFRLGAADGGVFAFGTSQNFGTMTGNKLHAPAVGMATTPDSLGYWLAAADGGVFAFGDAGFFGSLGDHTHLNAPIVGMAATPDGQGYWLAASDGGVMTFGYAPFDGSMAGRNTEGSKVGILSTPDGQGYWLVATDGGVFAFGDAPFLGSLPALQVWPEFPVGSVTS